MIKIIKQLYANFLARRERARIRNKGKQFLAELKAKGPNLDRVGLVFVRTSSQRSGTFTNLKHK